MGCNVERERLSVSIVYCLLVWFGTRGVFEVRTSIGANTNEGRLLLLSFQLQS